MKTAPRVALLADEPLGKLVALVLSHLDAQCEIVRSEQEFRALVHRQAPHLYIADLDRHDHAPEWGRFDGTAIPCVGLTRKREAAAKLEAFTRGAYDVIEVPFTPDEIVVRTMASYGRAHGRMPELRRSIATGPFEMDLLDQLVYVEGKPLRLTPLEMTLLYLFLANPRMVLTRDSILTNVWGVSSGVTSNVIDRHIRDLRVKLQEDWRTPRYIETVPGSGYRFIAGAQP